MLSFRMKDNQRIQIFRKKMSANKVLSDKEVGSRVSSCNGRVVSLCCRCAFLKLSRQQQTDILEHLIDFNHSFPEDLRNGRSTRIRLPWYRRCEARWPGRRIKVGNFSFPLSSTIWSRRWTDETHGYFRIQNPGTSVYTTGFKDMFLKPQLQRAIAECGFEHPSEVQQECIPQAMIGVDILCQAKSGMGKTAVFVLTILH